MPSVIETSLLQKAVLWQPLDPDGYGGGGITESPVEIDTRWVDGAVNRDDANVSRVPVDRDIVVASYLRKGPISELTPANMEEYPPPDGSLDDVNTHHNFDSDLTAEAGPGMAVDSGSVVHVTGIVDDALQDGGEDFVISTIGDVDWDTAEIWAGAFWSKATVPDDSIDTIVLEVDIVGNLDITCRAGLVNTVTINSTVFTLATGWLDDFAHVGVLWEKGDTPRLFIAGIEQTATTAGTPLGVAFVDGEIEITGTVDVSATGEVFIDDLRTYIVTVRPRDIQLLAAVHPAGFINAQEVLDFIAGDSLNGQLRYRRVDLSQREV